MVTRSQGDYRQVGIYNKYNELFSFTDILSYHNKYNKYFFYFKKNSFNISNKLINICSLQLYIHLLNKCDKKNSQILMR